MDGMGTDEETVYQILSGKTDAEREVLKATYERITGVSLIADLEGNFEGVELGLVKELLAGNELALEAKGLFDAMDGMGTDEETVYQILSGKTDAEREVLKATYERITGSTLQYDLAHDFEGVELDKAMDLLKTGKVSDVVLIRLAVEGIGTDEKALFALLRSCDQERLEQLKAGYKDRYEEGLEERLIAELSMREELEAKIALMGKPTTLEERVKQIQLRMDYEDGLLAEFFQGTLFEFTTGENLRRNVAGAVSLLEIHRNDNDHDRSLNKKEREEIDRLLRFAELDLDTLKRNAGRIRSEPNPQEDKKAEDATH
jgi:hypothetical protein